MKRIYSCAMAAFFLLAAMLSGCSSSAPAGQQDQNTQGAPLITETAEQSSLASEAEETGSGESVWTPVLECKIKHQTYMVGFINENFGITVGAHGEIHYSGDGGQTWPGGENNSLCRYCLDIVDENTAWCGGNGNNVRVTGDGGKTWTAVSDINLDTSHSNITFVDATTGWIASFSKLAGTSDGGKTWTDIPLPEGAEGIAAICLRTPEEGYLLSRNGMLYKTADGGSTWSSRDLEFKNYGIIDLKKQPKLNSNNPTNADLSFADENNGTIVFIGLTKQGYKTWCLITDDGGVTWKSESIPKPGFTPSKVYISDDGQYLTLSDGSNNAAVLKKKA